MAYYMLETALPPVLPHGLSLAYPWHTNSREFPTPGTPLAYHILEGPHTPGPPLERGEAVHRLGLGRAGWGHPL